jgi:hypothetical protein
LRIQQDCRLQASQTKLAEPFDNNNSPAHRQPLFTASNESAEESAGFTCFNVSGFQSFRLSQFQHFKVKNAERVADEFYRFQGFPPWTSVTSVVNALASRATTVRSPRNTEASDFATLTLFLPTALEKARFQDSSVFQALKQPASVHAGPLKL